VRKNSTVEISFRFFNCACATYVSWFLFLSLCLSLNVCTSVQLYYDSLYVRILLFIVILILLLSEYPHESAILWLIVRVYVRLLMHVFQSSLWMPLSVFGYIVTDCPCIGSSLDPHFSVCFYLSQYPRILPLILRVYVRHFTCVSISLFVFECVHQCPNISSFILDVYVHVLIRVSVSLFLWFFLCLCSAISSLIVRI